MSIDADVDLAEDRLFFISTHIVWKVVCAPNSWRAERVAEEATKADPPGTSANRWVVSSPEPDQGFDGKNSAPCNDDCRRTHWFLNC